MTRKQIEEARYKANLPATAFINKGYLIPYPRLRRGKRVHERGMVWLDKEQSATVQEVVSAVYKKLLVDEGLTVD